MTGESVPPSGNALVVVVTGLSGAGRSTTLHTLEDLGFFCIDNLPTQMAAEAVAVCERGGMTRIALGLDVRVRAFLGEVGKTIEELRHGGSRHVEVLFLDAQDETILARFSETRRPHALASGSPGGAASVLEGVALERQRLSPLRASATRVIDTTNLSVHELRRAIIAYFGPAAPGAHGMRVRVVSFGFKYGAPVDADLVFDVRFLQNPYFVADLKRLPGTDPRIETFVRALPDTGTFLDKTVDLLQFVLPKYEREGKSYLTIAIGCTGGRHRSVVVATLLAERLGGSAKVSHRDVHRGNVEIVAPSSSPDSGQAAAGHRELSAELSPLPPAGSSKVLP
jgi:RNase adapter protein RapZ